MAVHGAVLLRSKLFTADEIIRITSDHRSAGLEPREVAMLDLVEKIVEHAHEVTRADIDGLRAHGFDDGEIVDIAAAASVRCFISKLLDTLGAEIDPSEHDDPEVMRLVTFER